MTHQEILTKAIEKAVAGGWYSFANDAFGKITIGDVLLRYNPHGQGIEWTVKGHESNWSLIEALIYSHEFAQALWGDTPLRAYQWHAALSRDDTEELLESGAKENWQYHLQQMVIAEDPIAYLGNNI